MSKVGQVKISGLMTRRYLSVLTDLGIRWAGDLGSVAQTRVVNF